MTLKKQIKKLDHYDVHERHILTRLGAVVLTGAAVLSMVAESHDATRQAARKDVVVNSNYIAAPVAPPEPAEKNEMVRMPIKFDDGLRATATTGA